MNADTEAARELLSELDARRSAYKRERLEWLRLRDVVGGNSVPETVDRAIARLTDPEKLQP